MSRRAVLVGVGLAIAARADATVVTSNMTVTASVNATCSITAGAMGFGTYNTLTGAALDGTATLAVQCTKGAITTITLGQGNNPASGSSDVLPLRQLKSGLINALSYTLYTDSTRLLIWGNTTLTGMAYVPASASSNNITVYGRIASGQDVPAGSYSDTVVATISF